MSLRPSHVIPFFSFFTCPFRPLSIMFHCRKKNKGLFVPAQDKRGWLLTNNSPRPFFGVSSMVGRSNLVDFLCVIRVMSISVINEGILITFIFEASDGIVQF